MNEIPWIELAILIAAVGAVCVGALRQSDDARRWGLAFSGAAFLLALAGAAQFTFATGPGDEAGNWFTNLVGRQWLGFDRLNAPLLPLVALLYFLTILATQRTKVRRFSFAWTLATSAIALGALACREPWGIIALLCAETMFPFLELRARGKPTRVYVLHMAAFVGLLVLGWSLVEWEGDQGIHSLWAVLPIFAAVLMRSGFAPSHCWLTDLFDHATFGTALLFVTPMM
jgi:NADH-quinone oxidoreductase subunit M